MKRCLESSDAAGLESTSPAASIINENKLIVK
jgi:hypothetical protein